MKVTRKLHQYTSVLVLTPLVIWLFSGVVLNLIDHQKYSGNNKRVILDRGASHSVAYFPLSKLLNNRHVARAEVISLLSKPFYLLHHDRPAHAYFRSDKTLVDAVSGEHVQIDRDMAQNIALSSYSDQAASVSVRYIDEHIYDLNKERNPVWQINTNDALNTSIYVRANSGEVIAHVNDKKRFKNLMLRLHFLDIANVGSFNHWLNIVAALSLFFVSITGIIWFFKLQRSLD